MDNNPYSVGRETSSTANGLPGPKAEAMVRIMQIIAAALMMGVLALLFVVLLVTRGDIGGMQNADLITMIAGGSGFLMIVNHLVIPGIITRAQLKQAAASGILQKEEQAKIEHFCAIYQTQMIIGLALLEGAAFFNLIALMVEKSVASLGVVILLLSLMLLKFPTRDKVSFWVQDKLREMQLM